jgi:hypothetical protein
VRKLMFVTYAMAYVPAGGIRTLAELFGPWCSSRPTASSPSDHPHGIRALERTRDWLKKGSSATNSWAKRTGPLPYLRHARGRGGLHQAPCHRLSRPCAPPAHPRGLRGEDLDAVRELLREYAASWISDWSSRISRRSSRPAWTLRPSERMPARGRGETGPVRFGGCVALRGLVPACAK